MVYTYDDVYCLCSKFKYILHPGYFKQTELSIDVK